MVRQTTSGLPSPIKCEIISFYAFWTALKSEKPTPLSLWYIELCSRGMVLVQNPYEMLVFWGVPNIVITVPLWCHSAPTCSKEHGRHPLETHKPGTRAKEHVAKPALGQGEAGRCEGPQCRHEICQGIPVALETLPASCERHSDAQSTPSSCPK